MTPQRVAGFSGWLVIDDFACWHKCEVPTALGNFRFQG